MSFSWPYHFVSLSEEQKKHRRETLDLRGYYAQCSALILIICIRCYQSSTKVKTSGHGLNKKSTRPKQRSWYDTPPFQGWTETRKQYLLTFTWLAWLLILTVWNTEDDYLHLTKALGHVALSQLPFQVLMSPASYIVTSRPISPSALSILTSVPQPALTGYHRLLGRLVLSPLLLGHAILYFLFFVQSSHPDFGSLLVKRIRDFDVQCGIAALSAAIFILFLARPMSQKRGLRLWTNSIKTRRQIFYILHVLLVAAMCAAAYFHVSHAQVFVLEALGSFMVNVACCFFTKQ